MSMSNLQQAIDFIKSQLSKDFIFINVKPDILRTLIDGLEKQQRENESWADGCDELNIQITGQKKQIEKLRAENTAMKKALEWYGDEENYKRTEEDYQSGYPHEIMWDKGIKARNILAALTKEASQ